MSVLLCGCTTWTLIKCTEKKMDGNHQNSRCKAIYPPPISQTIQVGRSKHVSHRERNKDALTKSLMDSYAWSRLGGSTSKDLRTTATCRHWMQSRGPTRGDGRYGWTARKSQETPCYLQELMTMIIKSRGVRCVKVIVVVNETGDTSSNPGKSRLHFGLQLGKV